MILDIGTLTQSSDKARIICDSIENGFKNLTKPKVEKSVAYLIWKTPIILAGKKTFINYLLSAMGLKNTTPETRYPETDLPTLKAQDPDYLFLSSEPYPFAEKHKLEFEKELPRTKVVLVDGEMFSWYGSRLLKTSNYLEKLLTNIS